MIGVDIVESFRLGTDKSLDARYVVNSYYDVSSYWYPGMQVYQLSDGKFWIYEASIWHPFLNSNDVSSFTTYQYVDGSLNTIRAEYIPDVSLGAQFYWDPSNYLHHQELKGTINPVSPSEGDQFYKTDIGLWFAYDGSRGKYLTPRHTLDCGRTSAVAGSTVYMRVGDGTQSSNSGFKMIRDGTITGFSVQNSTTLTANRLFQIRVNDVSTLTTTILSGTSGAVYTNGNANFNSGNLIQAVALPGGTGSALNNVIVVIEIAWRT